MSELHLKTRDFTLLVCSNIDCRVSTFILVRKGDTCPGCKREGSHLRTPYDGRGAPGWTGRSEDD